MADGTLILSIQKMADGISGDASLKVVLFFLIVAFFIAWVFMNSNKKK